MTINELSPKHEASGSSFAFGHRRTPSGAELIETIVQESTHDVESTDFNSSTEQLLDDVFPENKSLRSSLRQKSSIMLINSIVDQVIMDEDEVAEPPSPAPTPVRDPDDKPAVTSTAMPTKTEGELSAKKNTDEEASTPSTPPQAPTNDSNSEIISVYSPNTLGVASDKLLDTIVQDLTASVPVPEKSAKQSPASLEVITKDTSTAPDPIPNNGGTSPSVQMLISDIVEEATKPTHLESGAVKAEPATPGTKRAAAVALPTNKNDDSNSSAVQLLDGIVEDAVSDDVKSPEKKHNRYTHAIACLGCPWLVCRQFKSRMIL